MTITVVTYENIHVLKCFEKSWGVNQSVESLPGVPTAMGLILSITGNWVQSHTQRCVGHPGR